jgi:hypothetical protein
VQLPRATRLFIRIRGVLHYLWRAVDQHGVVLDILVQDRRNGAAAKRFFKHLLHGLQYKPRRLVTDGLRSYGVAQRAVLPDVRHRTSRYLNNRAENSHRPTPRREGQMQRFKSDGQAHRPFFHRGELVGVWWTAGGLLSRRIPCLDFGSFVRLWGHGRQVSTRAYRVWIAHELCRRRGWADTCEA